MKRSLARLLILCGFLNLLASSSPAFSHYTDVYYKFYDDAIFSCKEILGDKGIPTHCNVELAKCMTRIFQCAKNDHQCIKKIWGGSTTVACVGNPFSTGGADCDGSTSKAQTEPYLSDCVAITTLNVTDPGCPNRVVEIGEDCDDGGLKPDKCPDDCKNAVAFSGGVTLTTSNFGTITTSDRSWGGFVPFSGDSGSAEPAPGGPSGGGTPSADPAIVSGSGSGTPASGGSSSTASPADSNGQGGEQRANAATSCSFLMTHEPINLTGFWILGAFWTLPVTLLRFKEKKLLKNLPL